MLPKISWKKIIKFGYGDIPSIGRKIIVSAGGWMFVAVHTDVL